MAKCSMPRLRGEPLARCNGRATRALSSRPSPVATESSGAAQQPGDVGVSPICGRRGTCGEEIADGAVPSRAPHESALPWSPVCRRDEPPFRCRGLDHPASVCVTRTGMRRAPLLCVAYEVHASWHDFGRGWRPAPDPRDAPTTVQRRGSAPGRAGLSIAIPRSARARRVRSDLGFPLLRDRPQGVGSDSYRCGETRMSSVASSPSRIGSCPRPTARPRPPGRHSA